MNWKEMWMRLFGTTECLGLNMGFWVSMAVVVLIVVAMNIVFWTMKPKEALEPQDEQADAKETV